MTQLTIIVLYNVYCLAYKIIISVIVLWDCRTIALFTLHLAELGYYLLTTLLSFDILIKPRSPRHVDVPELSVLIEMLDKIQLIFIFIVSIIQYHYQV